MGHDSFVSLPGWNQASDLMKLISGISVVSRLEEDSTHLPGSQWALEQNPQLEIKFLGHHPYEGLASRHLK
jgi:hypothetical protein